MNKYLHVLLSLPKTIYFNFRVFQYSEALKLPVLLDYRTKLYRLNKGMILIKGEVSPFMIKIGWGHGSLGVYCNPLSYVVGGADLFSMEKLNLQKVVA